MTAERAGTHALLSLTSWTAGDGYGGESLSQWTWDVLATGLREMSGSLCEEPVSPEL